MDVGLHIPFIEHLGVEILAQEPGRVTTALALRPELHNSWHAAHGGVIMTLADVTAGMAVRAAAGVAGGVATVDLTVKFVAPGRQRLTCTGWLVHRGRTLATAGAEVHGPDGELVATALGTFTLRPPTGGKDGEQR